MSGLMKTTNAVICVSTANYNVSKNKLVQKLIVKLYSGLMLAVDTRKNSNWEFIDERIKENYYDLVVVIPPDDDNYLGRGTYEALSLAFDAGSKCLILIKGELHRIKSIWLNNERDYKMTYGKCDTEPINISVVEQNCRKSAHVLDKKVCSSAKEDVYPLLRTLNVKVWM